MGQPAAQKTTAKKTVKSPATPAQDEIQQYEAAINAKQLFYGSVLDMGWRLAAVVIVPIFIGVRLDDHYHTSPSWTLTAIILAFVGAGVVVTKSVKSVNQDVNQQLQPVNQDKRKKTK